MFGQICCSLIHHAKCILPLMACKSISQAAYKHMLDPLNSVPEQPKCSMVSQLSSKYQSHIGEAEHASDGHDFTEDQLASHKADRPFCKALMVVLKVTSGAKTDSTNCTSATKQATNLLTSSNQPSDRLINHKFKAGNQETKIFDCSI